MEQMSAWGLTISHNFTEFRRKMLISVKKTHVSERGCHFCEFCENDARFPRVEFVDLPKKSRNFHEKTLNFNEKRTSSLNVHEKTYIFAENAQFSF